MSRYFAEGAVAYRAGLKLTDNPYSEGSNKSQQWRHGFYSADLDNQDETNG